MEEADEKSTDSSVSVTSCEQAKWKILSESLLIFFPRDGDQEDEITDSNQKDGRVQKGVGVVVKLKRQTTSSWSWSKSKWGVGVGSKLV